MTTQTRSALDEAFVRELARAGVRLTDISDETIPEDFSRNRRIHRAYLVERA